MQGVSPPQRLRRHSLLNRSQRRLRCCESWRNRSVQCEPVLPKHRPLLLQGVTRTWAAWCLNMSRGFHIHYRFADMQVSWGLLGRYRLHLLFGWPCRCRWCSWLFHECGQHVCPLQCRQHGQLGVWNCTRPGLHEQVRMPDGAGAHSRFSARGGATADTRTDTSTRKGGCGQDAHRGRRVWDSRHEPRRVRLARRMRGGSARGV
mmetsp:Transcript_74728/g.206017  ORF Transcript_74728/g.206017 Transcript_74728/m.206017 type:complete len:204 (+) Transcript_74728:117-728(+)